MISFKEFDTIKNSMIGFEFEFYSKYSREELKDKLENHLDKKVQIIDIYHSEFEPTSQEFKLEFDNSGGSLMNELITGPLDSDESFLILEKVLEFIHKNGYTNERCSLHINISFKEKNDIINLNVVNFIVNFDENKIYEKFPHRRESLYAKSIEKIYVKNDIPKNYSDKFNNSNYIYPSSKYYGINFDKRFKNYLEYRYIGGKDYETKHLEIKDLIYYFIINLNKSLTIDKSSLFNDSWINNQIFYYNRVKKSFSTFKEFKEEFKKIKFTVDLEENNVEFYFKLLKDDLFNLVYYNEIQKGSINYDTDRSRLQLSNIVIKDCLPLKYLDIINCLISCDIDDSEMHNCIILNSKIKNSLLFKKNLVYNSKIKGSVIGEETICDTCYIEGTNSYFYGKLENSIFRSGNIYKNAVINNSEIIEHKKINN